MLATLTRKTNDTTHKVEFVVFYANVEAFIAVDPDATHYLTVSQKPGAPPVCPTAFAFKADLFTNPGRKQRTDGDPLKFVKNFGYRSQTLQLVFLLP